MLPFKIKVGVYCKETNHHGLNAVDQPWDQATVHGWCVRRIHGIRKGYFRLMLYAPSGKCWNLDIYKPKPYDSEPYWSI